MVTLARLCEHCKHNFVEGWSPFFGPNKTRELKRIFSVNLCSFLETPLIFGFLCVLESKLFQSGQLWHLDFLRLIVIDEAHRLFQDRLINLLDSDSNTSRPRDSALIRRRSWLVWTSQESHLERIQRGYRSQGHQNRSWAAAARRQESSR